MIAARALAGQLGLRAQIRISHTARCLHLQFADTSALWLSEFGTGLAAPARPDSDAHRFAVAHAQQFGWKSLALQQYWPVPQPCSPGDWLTAPEEQLPALQTQILRAAQIERLEGSVLELDDILSQYPPVPMPRLPISHPRRRFVIFSGSCIAQSPNQLARQVAQLDMLLAESPALLCLAVSSDANKLVPVNPMKLSVHLRKTLESMAKEQIDKTPAVSETEDPDEFDEFDEPENTPDMSM